MTITIYTELFSSKNSRRSFNHPTTGRIVNIKSKKALQNEDDLIQNLLLHRYDWQDYLVKHMARNIYDDESQIYPLRLEITIYRKTHGKWDYHNLIQNLADCMVKAGWLPDDDTRHVGFYPPLIGDIHRKDSKNPRIEIKIL